MCGAYLKFPRRYDNKNPPIPPSLVLTRGITHIHMVDNLDTFSGSHTSHGADCADLAAAVLMVGCRVVPVEDAGDREC